MADHHHREQLIVALDNLENQYQQEITELRNLTQEQSREIGDLRDEKGDAQNEVTFRKGQITRLQEALDKRCRIIEEKDLEIDRLKKPTQANTYDLAVEIVEMLTSLDAADDDYWRQVDQVNIKLHKKLETAEEDAQAELFADTLRAIWCQRAAVLEYLFGISSNAVIDEKWYRDQPADFYVNLDRSNRVRLLKWVRSQRA